MKCRHCFSNLEHVFLDLGFAPPSNAYLNSEDLLKPEKYYPLKLFVCVNCWLVQTQDFTKAEDLFNSEYAYFSSTSKSWLEHSSKYVEKIIPQLNLSKESFVVEVASNDGYLLKNFLSAKIPCLGIEPTNSTADYAENLGIQVLRKFFGRDLARNLVLEGKKADLIIGNNVYAHVPDINDFTIGLKYLLKSEGTITLEFPHLLQLIEHTQFDTVYHEHFSYLSLYTVSKIFDRAELKIFDVEKLSTHGGSLRIYGCHVEDDRLPKSSVLELLEEEEIRGLLNIKTYLEFQVRANSIKNQFLEFLLEQKHFGKKVAAYGAAAKGNTLLNYAGVKQDLLPFVCDAAKSKQGKFLPGSHIPILSPSALTEKRPDMIIIFPWNIKSEIQEGLNYVKKWDCKFATAIPKLEIFP